MQGDHRVSRLKLHELHVLLAVAQAGSMAKAAAQLAISEPAVSRAISDMEHTLGVSLFNRSSRGVEPTPYGCALIKRGVAVFDELRLGIREIEFIKDPTIGEVHIGATSTIAEVGIVAAVIDHMSQKYPRVSFHVVEATPDRLFHELRERNLDLIILLTFDPLASNDIVSEILYEDRMVVLAAANNPWTRRCRIELADLVNEHWTLPEPGHPVTSIVAQAFRAIGCEAPRVTATAAPGRIRDTLLATGRFLTVAQESALHFGATLPPLKVLPLELSMARGTTNIMTLKKRALSPAVQLFIEHIREAARPLAKTK
jgi:DNA-binding transcriptional LysR family regulator